MGVRCPRSVEPPRSTVYGCTKTGMKRCPACGSGNVTRSGMRGAERESHAFRSPYRCHDCSTRFWVLSRKTRIGAVAASVVLLTATVIEGGPFLLARYAARHASGVADVTATDGVPGRMANDARSFDATSQPILVPGSRER